MNHRSLSISILSLLIFGHIARAQEDKPPTAEEIREAKVYDAIAQMISRREELLRGKFAVVLHGEGLMIGGDLVPEAKPFICARVVDAARSFDLKAHFVVMYSREESGTETVRRGTSYKYRDNWRLFTEDYVDKDKEEPLSKWKARHRAYGFDPYDDDLSGASAFGSGTTYRQIELTVLQKYKLLRTEEGLGGKLISHWAYKPRKGYNYRIRMEFDPAYDMNLVRHSLHQLEHKTNFGEVRIEWTRHHGTLVPKRIELAHGSISSPGDTTEYTFKCLWAIGDEVPDEIFTAKDHLAAVMDHFKIPHSTMVNGEPLRVTYVPPEDLYEDKKKE